jgi:hypothetical protein
MPVQMFRRFQVTLTSLSDASALIQSIQGCCICTPARGSENQMPTQMPPPSTIPTAARSPSMATSQQVTRGESRIQSYGKAQNDIPSHPSVSASIQRTASSAIFETDSVPVLARTLSTQPPQSYHDISLVNSAYPRESQMLLPSTIQSQAFQLPLQTPNVAFQPITYDSRASSTVSDLRPATWSSPQGLPSASPAAPSSDPIVPTIVSVAKLYQLPIDELESAVADILREPGFEEFVRDLFMPLRETQICGQIGKLDKMWGLHGFIRR